VLQGVLEDGGGALALSTHPGHYFVAAPLGTAAAAQGSGGSGASAVAEWTVDAAMRGTRLAIEPVAAEGPHGATGADEL
jgi:hypothetical protein